MWHKLASIFSSAALIYERSIFRQDVDGGLSKFPTNKAGVQYGSGYCDSKCPQDVKFINNRETDTMLWGCVWYPNGASNFCDGDGCDFNPYPMGNEDFHGSGLKVDTTKKFVVVTQFLTDDETASGTLSEIHRFYFQDEIVIASSNVSIQGMSPDYNSITTMGGLKSLSNIMAAGMVLVFSVQNNPAPNMNWLDSTDPATANPFAPDVARGPCPTIPIFTTTTQYLQRPLR
ncbi:concanavalin A-like lectin/glucanase domain-containing protein [Gymnopilus junonius]|uniref:Glucanase n=1 Tax=Gymnopilus junonius TaxID=109634 RepID=A0A9P5NYU9_GYMJU|nr:concanavalin A-like lectin/glucanase domain-containing protein [Gymnopilus junonius]